MKFYVHEVYTPDDTDCDRRRKDATFESDSRDIVELARLGMVELGWAESVVEEAKSDLLDDNDQYGPKGWDDEYEFVAMVFVGNGEYEITISNYKS